MTKLDSEDDPSAVFETLADRYAGEDDEFAALCEELANQFRENVD